LEIFSGVYVTSLNSSNLKWTRAREKEVYIFQQLHRAIAPAVSKGAVGSVEPTLCLVGVDLTSHPVQPRMAVGPRSDTPAFTCIIAPILHPTIVGSTGA